MSLNIVIIIQARMGSTRLPRKVLKPLAGKTVLYHMVSRVLRSRVSDRVVVATTVNREDNPVEELCKREGFESFRGDPADLLDRHYQAGISYRADAVVKIPSDCPLIDPHIIDRVLKFYADNRERFDYVSNLHPPTYPDGNDVEVISMAALEKAWLESKIPFDREHTTPYIWNNPEGFRIGNITWESGLDYSRSHRWVLDYEEDYEFIRTVYDELSYDKPYFGIYDILSLLERRPDIEDINRKFLSPDWYQYQDHLNRITANQRDGASLR